MRLLPLASWAWPLRLVLQPLQLCLHSCSQLMPCQLHQSAIAERKPLALCR